MLLVIRFANTFYKLLRNESMVGCGYVLMDTNVFIDIAYPRDMSSNKNSKRVNL